jgi:hypothetical protein
LAVPPPPPLALLIVELGTPPSPPLKLLFLGLWEGRAVNGCRCLGNGASRGDGASFLMVDDKFEWEFVGLTTVVATTTIVYDYDNNIMMMVRSLNRFVSFMASSSHPLFCFSFPTLHLFFQRRKEKRLVLFAPNN